MARRYDSSYVATLPRALAADAVLDRARKKIMPSKSAVFFGAVQQHTLRSAVAVDAAVRAASNAFEYSFDGTSAFEEPSLPKLPPEWRVGLLVGKSGSGKSTCLARLCTEHRASGRDAPRDSATLGGEGEPAAEGVWAVDAPAAASLPPSALEFLRRHPSSALAAVGEAASSRPFAHFSRGERTLLALMRLCTDGSAAAESDDTPVTARGAADAPILAVADEFTSFVDRPMAAAAAAATRTLWMRRALSDRLICAGVHADILSCLKPDWAYDTDARRLTVYEWDADDVAAAENATAPLPQAAVAAVAAASRTEGASAAELFAPPSVEVVVRQTTADADSDAAAAASKKDMQRRADERVAYRRRMWELFKPHHYMSGELSSSSNCAVARWGSTPVGFIATLCKPGAVKKDDRRIIFREHRLVVLPDFQGLGIGLRLSEATGSRFLSRDNRYTSRTAHFVLRNARERSSKWRQVLRSGQKEGQGTAASGNLGRFGRKKEAPKSATKAAAAKEGGAGESDEDGDGDGDRILYTHEYVGDEREQAASLAAIARMAGAVEERPPPTPAQTMIEPARPPPASAGVPSMPVAAAPEASPSALATMPIATAAGARPASTAAPQPATAALPPATATLGPTKRPPLPMAMEVDGTRAAPAVAPPASVSPIKPAAINITKFFQRPGGGGGSGSGSGSTKSAASPFATPPTRTV